MCCNAEPKVLKIMRKSSILSKQGPFSDGGVKLNIRAQSASYIDLLQNLEALAFRARSCMFIYVLVGISVLFPKYKALAIPQVVSKGPVASSNLRNNSTVSIDLFVGSAKMLLSICLTLFSTAPA
uniref:Uncharacterized protein n=1 Tax=Glossina austeni TaxID=7395 RepID=A0A1A9UX09_GLOAU